MGFYTSWFLMSALRAIMEKVDRRAYRNLTFARHFWNIKFLFLTMTFARMEEHPHRKLARLLAHLRKKRGIEYFAVRTGEGAHGSVFQLALVSKYIHHTEIRKLWERLTGAWNIHISYEREWSSFVQEMTRQYHVIKYSNSKGLFPKGSQLALDRLSKHFHGNIRILAYRQFAARCRLNNGDVEKAYYQTCTCIRQFHGRCSIIKNRLEICL
jgi:hypothetical protein